MLSSFLRLRHVINIFKFSAATELLTLSYQQHATYPTFQWIFLRQSKTSPDSRPGRFCLELIDRTLYITEPETHLDSLHGLESKPFLTCNIYMTAIGFQCMQRPPLRAPIHLRNLEISLYGKSDTCITVIICNIMYRPNLEQHLRIAQYLKICSV